MRGERGGPIGPRPRDDEIDIASLAVHVREAAGALSSATRGVIGCRVTIWVRPERNPRSPVTSAAGLGFSPATRWRRTGLMVRV